MKHFTKFTLWISLLICIALPRGVAGSVDDAQSFALQAAEPYVKEGFQVREDYWGGDLGSGGSFSGVAQDLAFAVGEGIHSAPGFGG